MAWQGEAAIAGLLAALCVGCGDDGNGSGGARGRDGASAEPTATPAAAGGGEFTEAEAKRWATRYVKAVQSWAREWKSANRAAGRQDFTEAGRIVRRLGRDDDGRPGLLAFAGLYATTNGPDAANMARAAGTLPAEDDAVFANVRYLSALDWPRPVAPAEAPAPEEPTPPEEGSS